MDKIAAKEQLDYLKKGVENLIEEADPLKKLESGKPLTVKVGFDPEPHIRRYLFRAVAIGRQDNEENGSVLKHSVDYSARAYGSGC